MSDTNDSSLDKILKRASPGGPSKNGDAPPPEDADGISYADMNGTHTMRPANKNLTRLHIVTKDGKVRSFQYAYLDAESTYEGGTFTLRFAGVKHWQVTVKGSGKMFWAVYDYCTLHRCPYLREETGSMPGANGDGEKTVFTSIEFTDVTPKDGD